jgi:hypothetical protein
MPPGISYIAGKQPFKSPHILHDYVIKPTFPWPIKHGDKSRNTEETVMLTEVDIERIMAAKTRLAESVADDSELDLVIDDEIFELMGDDSLVSETNGLM